MSGQNIVRPLCTLLALIVTLAFSTPAQAHSFNESYVYFDVTEDSLSGRIEITLTDLTRIQQQAAKIETPLTRKEIRRAKNEFHDYFRDRLRLSFEGRPLPIEFNDLTFFKTKVGRFAQFHFDVQGIQRTPTTIDMSYDVLFSTVDPEHRGFGLIGSNARNGMDENEAYISLIFSPGDGVQSLFLNDEPTKDIARAFLELGIWHIWLGMDHLLFLVTLLLGAVMRVENERWVPSDRIGGSLRRAVKIVTAFTIAHTVALFLGTFGVITLPVSLVEAVIALSIIVVAVGNLIPRFHTQSWKVVFVFGLFHGFGFASLLDPLGMDATRKAMGVLTFNLGIEIGQLAVVLVLFPLLFALRGLNLYRIVVLQAASVALIAFAALWFVERTLGPFAVLAGGVN